MNPDADEQYYRDTEAAAFPKIDDRQPALLEPLGKRRILRRGEMIYKAGQRELGLFVVLRGEAEVFEKQDDYELVLREAGERDFIGDVATLQGYLDPGHARIKSEEAEILEVPSIELRRALADLPQNRGRRWECARLATVRARPFPARNERARNLRRGRRPLRFR